MPFPIHLLSQGYNYMFYLGLLVPLCTHMEGPRSPRPVSLFTLNYRVFRPFVGDRRPSSQTVVPRPGPSSLIPGRRPSSFDPFWHIYSRLRFGRSGLITYFTLVVPIFIYLSQYSCLGSSYIIYNEIYAITFP